MGKIMVWTVAGLMLAIVLVGGQGQVSAADGKAVFLDKCVPCHGPNGDGKGAMASNFSHHPGNFSDPKFWQGDGSKKIHDAITNGKDQMIPVDLKPDEIKAVTEYITKTFKK